MSHNRSAARMLAIWGVIFLLIACVIPTKDKFSADVGGISRVITRQGNPAIYWGMEATAVLVGISLLLVAYRKGRRNI